MTHSVASRNRNSGQVNLPMTPNWRAIFESYDLDHDGYISYAEFRRLLNDGSKKKDIPKRAQREILKQADTNGDEKLNLEEFIKLVESDGFVHSFIERRLDRYVKAVVPTRTQHDIIDYAGEYEEEYTCRPPALCMLTISLLEIISFLYDWGVSGETEASGPLASKIIYNPYRRREAWRYLTYMFVHVGSIHITVNLLVQILLGVPLEMVHKGWRVCIVYIAGVVAGSLGTSISDPGVFLAGASGGVYALMTAHVATLVMNWQEMQFAIIQLIVFLVIAAVDIGTAIYNRYVVGVKDRIGYVAHLAGGLAGLFVGIFILRNISKRSWEKKVWWAALGLYLTLLIVAIGWNAIWTGYFPPERWD